MLFRPAWRAVLSVRNPHCQFHQVPSVAARRPRAKPRSERPRPRTPPWERTGKGHLAALKPRRVTLHAENPQITSQQQVLSALHQFCATTRSWQDLANDWDQTVIILATPSFVKWLEDDSFIERFLGTITLDEEARASFGTIRPFGVEVLCACVDGLSPGVDSMPFAVSRGVKEGFSILQARTFGISPMFWDAGDSASRQRLATISSVTFTGGKVPKDPTQVVLPLANTLFLNGKHGTLLISEWKLEEGSFVKVKSAERKHHLVTVFDELGLGPHSIHVPVAPLTPARRIVSGMGNIVKQIDFGENNPRPASRELEENIDEYLSQTKWEKSTIAVWALIVPKRSISNTQPPGQYELLSDADRVKLRWRVTPSNPAYIGYWLSQGAKLCRVLSGGGGWGVKQGLLSLDPQSTFNEISDARFDFSTWSPDDQPTSALGSIAEPDSFIQFFVVDNRVRKARRSTPTDSESQRSDLWQSSTVFGTIPSTVDDQKSSQNDSETRHEVICHPGLFGAVSESGIYLKVSDPSLKQAVHEEKAGVVGIPPMRTKLDIPYSYIYRETKGGVESSRVKSSKPEGQSLAKASRGTSRSRRRARKRSARALIQSKLISDEILRQLESSSKLS